MRYRPTVTVGITLLSALGLAGMADPAAAESWVEIPQVELSRYGFAAEAVDATAIYLNPAALAGGPGTNLYADITGRFDFPLEWTAALQGKALGFGYRHRQALEPGDLPEGESSATDGGALDTYILAGGYGPPSFRLGLSTAWNKTTLPGDDGLSVNAGFQSFTNQSFAVGFVVENIQHPDFLGGQARPRYTYGLTIRAVPQLLTLNVSSFSRRAV